MPKNQFKESEKEPTMFDVLRLGESYTSLILGIVVVIVSTVLLLSFVHNKNKGVTPEQKTQVAKVTEAPQASESAVTKAPTVLPTTKPTSAKVKVGKKESAKVVTPTAKTKGPTVVPTQTVKPAAKVEIKGTYKVAKGDTLWLIAEKNYKSGYNWVDIARVNNLPNANFIKEGDKLVLPKVKSKLATVTPAPKAEKKVAKATPTVAPTKTVAKATPTPVAKVPAQVKQPEMKKITGAKYTVVKGDNLWNISVRSYGDGYQWVKLAKVNKLVNPDIIHPGNKLTIPRK